MKHESGKRSSKWKQHAIDFYMKNQSEECLVENLLMDNIREDFKTTLRKLYEKSAKWNTEKYCRRFTDLLSNEKASRDAEKKIFQSLITTYPNWLNQVQTQLEKMELEMPSPMYKTILLGRIAPLLLMATEMNHPIMMSIQVKTENPFIKKENDSMNNTIAMNTSMDNDFSDLPELIPKHEADSTDDEIPALIHPDRKISKTQELSVLEQIEMWHSE